MTHTKNTPDRCPNIDVCPYCDAFACSDWSYACGTVVIWASNPPVRRQSEHCRQRERIKRGNKTAIYDCGTYLTLPEYGRWWRAERCTTRWAVRTITQLWRERDEAISQRAAAEASPVRPPHNHPENAMTDEKNEEIAISGEACNLLQRQRWDFDAAVTDLATEIAKNDGRKLVTVIDVALATARHYMTVTAKLMTACRAEIEEGEQRVAEEEK